MNFDDIQSLWNADDGGRGMVVPDNVEKIKAAHHPVDKIRKNMRHEAWGQLIALIVIGLYGRSMPTEIMSVIYYCLYGVMLAICGYYAYRFYRFYRRLGSSVLSAKEHLYEVYYDIQLHMEMYRLLTYALMMLAFGFVIMYMLMKPGFMHAAGTPVGVWMVFKIAAIFVVFMVLSVIATEVWLKIYYGKYQKEIKKIKDELKEDI
ncbi:hypothetical protein HHL17_29150 [Chitinophaga sp. G-6-1-13]|uniref:DUF3278 domain-containing protein n=1 Tax=Chitinophaga fulva TaxID=2728842 RepID=A0A848GRT8_9BACT|nr:hypothetical protein [Chitinophaga fulva]NML41296.1 hypothetical protein [Chitinophaga fulva]